MSDTPCSSAALRAADSIASRIPPGRVVELIEQNFYPMNESNRRIASINRIDEFNQRIEFQNDPKRPVDSLMDRQDRSKRAQESPRAPQDPLKTAQKPPKTVLRGPKSAQERPKTAPRRPQSPPGGHLGTNKSQDRKQDRPT